MALEMGSWTLEIRVNVERPMSNLPMSNFPAYARRLRHRYSFSARGARAGNVESTSIFPY
jgi:hypothetical protein